MQGINLPCFPALRVSASICIKGKGYARDPRPVAGKPALRPPVSPLTPIPATTRPRPRRGRERKTRLAGRVGLVTAASWPGCEAVANQSFVGLALLPLPGFSAGEGFKAASKPAFCVLVASN